MCGICGVIGESKDPVASFELLTQLFHKTESRGEDAAGYWGTQKGVDGAIAYHKEPGKSTDFIKKKVWRKIAKFDPNLMLLHCRYATPGVGVPSVNRNNHPFVSVDKSLSLVHNGKVPDMEYRALAQRYELVSQCDSEILLRVFEAGKFRDNETLQKDFPDWDTGLAVRLAALRDIWSYMTHGAMAVAIGEWLENGTRRLWFSRNKYRSLWLADLRHTLGQVFFFSTPKIWHDAISDCHLADNYLYNIQVIELPSEEIWIMQVSDDEPVLVDKNLLKFKVGTSNVFLPWKLNGDSFKIEQRKPKAKIISKLDHEENVVEDKPTAAVQIPSVAHSPEYAAAHATSRSPYYNTWSSDKGRKRHDNVTRMDDDIRLGNLDEPFLNASDADAACGQLSDICKRLEHLISDIQTTGENKLMENSISPGDFTDLIYQLEQFELDLKGTLNIAEG
jgi:predicted glutamine amidotransferase